MYIDLTNDEIKTILKETTFKNTQTFINDLKKHNIDLNQVLNIIEEYQSYFNTFIDLRQALNDGLIQIINIFDYKNNLKEYYNLIENNYSYELKRGTYLIIE